MSGPTGRLAEAHERQRGLLLSDRLNPLFVRDVQQSFTGRGFAAALLLALVGMLVVASLAVDGSGEARGAQALSMVLFALGLMVSLVVPMQSFHSTRQEMLGGAADQLLLSSLSPAAIVRGKLLAALLKIGLWVSLFSPLVALTWLLRGLSVTQIAVALLLAMLAGLAASAVAVLIGTLTVFRRAAVLVNLLAVLSLVGGGLGLSTALASVSFAVVRFGRGSGDMVVVIASTTALAAALLAFCVIAARSQFMHPHENRSTAFRIFLPVAAVAAWGWVLAAVERSSQDEALPVMTLAALAFGAFFFVFATTEERALSPRVRLSVPAGAGRAQAWAMFLPGGGRGVLWSLVLAILLPFGAGLLAEIRGVSLDGDVAMAMHLTALYAVFYALLGGLVRRRFAAGSAGTWWARVVVLGFLVLGTVLSGFMAAISHGSGWSPAHFINPFWTVAEFGDGDAPAALYTLLVVDAILLLCNLGALRDGLVEVGRASAARRTRAPAA